MCLLTVCRTVVFSVTVLYDERIVLVAEQRPDSTEEESYQWMSRVLQVHKHLTGLEAQSLHFYFFSFFF